jgi:hypothetical protein
MSGIQQPPLNLNSITDVASAPPGTIFATVIDQSPDLLEIKRALNAHFSQLDNRALLAMIEQSRLIEILGTFSEVVKSGAIDELEPLELTNMVRQNFLNMREGQQHLFDVLAFLQLLRSPGDSETPEEVQALSENIERLKKLFRLTLFDSRIAIQLMNLRDEKQEQARSCRSSECRVCDARFILSIGWYIVAEEAHNQNMFVRDSN